MNKNLSKKKFILSLDTSLSPYKDLISKEVDSTYSNVAKQIPLKDVSIVIQHEPERILSETGIGGFSSDENSVAVFLDAYEQNIESIVVTHLKRTLAHELHHASRSSKFPWDDSVTLIEAFVTEGLADHFDRVLNGSKSYPWSVALQKEEIINFLKQAEESEELGSDKYSHERWFFGTEDIPFWAGYAIGFYITKLYMDKQGKNAAELVHEPAINFLEVL